MVLHIPFWNTSYPSSNYLTNVLVANLAHTFGFFSEWSESLINIRKKVNILLFPKNHSYLSTDCYILFVITLLLLKILFTE